MEQLTANLNLEGNRSLEDKKGIRRSWFASSGFSKHHQVKAIFRSSCCSSSNDIIIVVAVVVEGLAAFGYDCGLPVTGDGSNGGG